MSTQIDSENKTDLDASAPDCWPPLAHIFLGPWPVKAGDTALCGAKLMGVDLRFTDCKVCERCVEILKQRLSK